MSSLLTTLGRSAVVPAALASPWAAVLLPAVLYVVSKREVSLSVQLR